MQKFNRASNKLYRNNDLSFKEALRYYVEQYKEAKHKERMLSPSESVQELDILIQEATEAHDIVIEIYDRNFDHCPIGGMYESQMRAIREMKAHTNERVQAIGKAFEVENWRILAI